MDNLRKLVTWVLQNGDRGIAAEIATNTEVTASELSMHIHNRRALSNNKLVAVVDYLLSVGKLTFKVDL